MLGRGISFISCGTSHTVVLTANNEIYSWGSGGCGRLGHGNNENVLSPKQIFKEGCQPWIFEKVSSGDMHTLAITESGELYSWGHGAFGALGHGDYKDYLKPTKVTVCLQFCH